MISYYLSNDDLILAKENIRKLMCRAGITDYATYNFLFDNGPVSIGIFIKYLFRLRELSRKSKVPPEDKIIAETYFEQLEKIVNKYI